MSELLATKLHPQRVLGSLLDRPRLMEKLGRPESAPKLTLITAPAGYGKSTLLLQLMREHGDRPGRIGWLSLDDGDNNADTFSLYLWETYRRSRTGDEPDALAAGDIAGRSVSPRARLRLLVETVQRAAHPVTLILDDFHVLTEQRVIDHIDWLIAALPPNMSIVIASRKRPELRCIAELKAKANLIEITAKELEFTGDECREFLTGEKSIVLSREALKSVHSKTEGWIAAIQLALLALRRLEDQEAFVELFSGTDRDIVGYLGEYVLGQLDAPTQRFLLLTSALERMCSDLCASVTGMHDASTRLAELEAAGLFLFALDRDNLWFRYHHLFREFLLSQLAAADETLYPGICRKAAEWFLTRGHTKQAIGYFLNAGEYAQACALMTEQAAQLVQYNGHHDTLLQWVERLPQEHVHENAEIAIGYLWSLIFTRQMSKAESVLEAFTAYCGRGLDPVLECKLEMLDAMRDVMAGEFLQARKKSSAWLEKWDDSLLFEHGAVLGVLGAACLHTLEFDLARRVLLQANREFQACHADYGVTWMDTIYSMVCVRQGQLLETRNLLQRRLAASDERLGEHSFASAMVNLSLAQVYYETDDRRRAADSFEKGSVLLDEHGLTETAAIGFVTRSRLLHRDGDSDAALSLLIAGEALARELQLSSLDTLLALERACLLLSLGLTESMEILYKERGFDGPLRDSRFTPYEILEIKTLRVRRALGHGDADEALRLLRPIVSECKAKQCNLLLQSLLILKARAYGDLGKMNHANRALQQVVQSAAKENRVALFIDEDIHLRDILPEFLQASEAPEIAAQPEVAKLKSVLRGYFEIPRRAEIASGGNGSAAHYDLTAREREILAYLQQGLSNQRLAEALFVSLSTVKWHLSRIYQKLGVKSRTQAVRVAREARILCE